jgi:Tol biopolymer transport system component
LAWTLAALSVLALIALLVWQPIGRGNASEMLQLSLARPDGAPFSRFGGLALSPDGKYAVFTGQGANGQRSLWLRRLDGSTIDPVPLTQGAFEPFWSPDSRSIGFFADGKLKRIDVGGGPPQVLCDASPFGGTWSRDGVILFGGDGPIRRVSAGGGQPTAITKLDPEEEGHRWPAFLPDGKHFLFLADANRTDAHELKVGSLDGGVKTLFSRAITNAIYVTPGFLMYIRDGALVAHAFDAKQLALIGEAKIISSDIVENTPNHHFEFSASDTGLLAYRSAARDLEVTWVDRTGKRLGGAVEQGHVGELALSPDGRRLILQRLDLSGRISDYWLRDLASGMSSRITFHQGDDHGTVWSPDGTEFVFATTRRGEALYRAPIANPTHEELLYTAPVGQMLPTSWSPDGRAVLFNHFEGDEDIWIFRFDDRKAEPLIQSPFAEGDAVFSPDGHWIAYSSDESGSSQIYIQSFPIGSKRIQVSANHGENPRWSRNGRELFYVGAGNEIISVPMDNSPADLTVGEPRQLFALGIYVYVPHPDGQRFLITQPRTDPFIAPITIVSGWQRGIGDRPR